MSASLPSPPPLGIATAPSPLGIATAPLLPLFTSLATRSLPRSQCHFLPGIVYLHDGLSNREVWQPFDAHHLGFDAFFYPVAQLLVRFAGMR